jgi:integrase/recombinase XerD
MVDPSRVRVTGPLVSYVDGFWAELAAAGYTAWSVEAQLRLMAHVSRWLAAQGLGVAGLTSEAVEEFLRARRGEGYVDRLSPQGLAPLLGYLRRLDVVPAASTQVTPVEQLVQDYCGYLLRERGLAAGSVSLHGKVARRFLSERSELIREDLSGLSAAEITAFVLRESTQRSEASTRIVVDGLRSLLRYLHVEGWTPIALAPAVPSVARRQHSLPRSLEAGHVTALLESCDRASAVGVRDYAILTLLARLGLRVGEVTRLRLDDVDWSAGELLVRGKGELMIRHAGRLRRGRLLHQLK